MKTILSKRTLRYLVPVFILALLNSSCEPDESTLVEATFPNIPEVFIDAFSAGLQYDAFGTSKVTAFDVDSDVVFEGTLSMRFDVPNTSDPEGGFAGGVFSTSVGRNLTDYNVLSFYARASKGETINEIGFGLTFEGEVYRTTAFSIQVGTAWQKYYIPIPDAAKLTQERGMLWIAEAADNGEAYQLWLDNVQFENVNTVLQEANFIFDGQDITSPANSGSTIPVTGTFVDYNLPNGLVQRITTTPAYYTYTSSDENVAIADEFGVISVLSDSGMATITATLAGSPTTGSVTIMEVDASNNVDDSDATEVALPLGFESSSLNYNPIGFEGAVPSIAANPLVGGLNNSANVLRSLKSQGSVFFAGQFIDLDTPVDFSQSESISALVLSPNAGVPIRLALENSSDPGSQIRVDLTTSTANQWEELVYDFSGQVNPSETYDRLVIIFDIDEVSQTPGDGSVYYIDDIQLGEGSGGGGGGGDNLLDNGDFEQGMVIWEGNAFNVQTNGGNSFNFADVQTAGNPFDVNLSQRGIDITEGQTFTLRFDASTDAGTGSRTIIAGIGLFVAPFTNQSETVTITSTLETYELTLTANFSSTDSRVLFDMGAETGVVVIDNVVLTLN